MNRCFRVYKTQGAHQQRKKPLSHTRLCAEDDAMTRDLTVDAVLFGFLVFSGILGNILVIHVVFQSASESPSRRLPPSDTILAHLSLANLLTSLFRTVPIFVSDLGFSVSLSPGWCRVFMLLWVWWRGVGCWATLALSVLHCATVRRRRVASGPLAQRRARRGVWGALGLVWGANLALSAPALAYGAHVSGNATVQLMVISCTTRPLLGCVWEFPARRQGAAFASASLALNEALPLLLMLGTNLATLRALVGHARAVRGEADAQASGAAERKAAHVITALVALFVCCWAVQLAAVTYYNHNGGALTEGLLTVAQFSASVFGGFSPMVVALGHGRLRRRIASMAARWTAARPCHGEDRTPPEARGQTIFVVQKERKETFKSRK
ncbi:olfactory receptor class A-like protein 4 [Betta splendens]|uniref:Olfactory receptor class A-like protein 4 n=1 Tax=Betta splendens TaxID=158456 RepID=A0A6P7MMT9_BETSP|nr:olfactory receptor class A-like protein 4 [Betta splendens]